jgi:hypothetical protein
LVVVTNFSDFHVQLYQHLDQKGAPATSPTPVHLPSAG